MTETETPPLYVAEIPLRWSDMDSLGHVNNAVYFTYCETARLGLLHHLGLGDYQGEVGPVVATASCTFKEQLTFPATLAVEVRCTKVGRTSFTLGYTLKRKTTEGLDPTLVCTGESVLVWVDLVRGGSVPLPDDLRQALG
ncbi:MAG: thioesterase family protein [Planctomycetota bacterium]